MLVLWVLCVLHLSWPNYTNRILSPLPPPHLPPSHLPPFHLPPPRHFRLRRPTSPCTTIVADVEYKHRCHELSPSRPAAPFPADVVASDIGMAFRIYLYTWVPQKFRACGGHVRAARALTFGPHSAPLTLLAPLRLRSCCLLVHPPSSIYTCRLVLVVVAWATRVVVVENTILPPPTYYTL